jgi:glyceraldehyde-3-phosphate dehydrogenase (NAD(P))
MLISPRRFSHQGPDAQTVDPDLDVITMAVMVPETLGHLHYWTINTTRPVPREEVIEVLRASSRIALVKASDGLGAINTIKELMLDLGRPHGNMYEVAVWENLIESRGNEIFYAYMVDNQAIVIPETVDAIRALHGEVKNAQDSIEMTNESLGIKKGFI